jgi:hypothetical protein
VEGEFRRFALDDLVDGRRAIRDDWAIGLHARRRLLRVLPRALAGCVPIRLCPGRLFARGARRAVYTAAPSRMTARPQAATRRERPDAEASTGVGQGGLGLFRALWPVASVVVRRGSSCLRVLHGNLCHAQTKRGIVGRVRRETRSFPAPRVWLPVICRAQEEAPGVKRARRPPGTARFRVQVQTGPSGRPWR